MSEQDIIRKIEKNLNIELKHLENIDILAKGYTLTPNGEVNALSLYNCKIKKNETDYFLFKRAHAVTVTRYKL